MALEKRIASNLMPDILADEWARLDPDYSGPEPDDIMLTFPPDMPEQNKRIGALLRSSKSKILAHFMTMGIPRLIVRRSFLKVLEDHGWYLKPNSHKTRSRARQAAGRA